MAISPILGIQVSSAPSSLLSLGSVFLKESSQDIHTEAFFFYYVAKEQ